MASATQQAPRGGEKARTQRTAPAQSVKQEQKKSVKSALHDIPQAAGIAIMAVLLAVSLFAGNFRALSAATPKDFLRQGDVKSIVEDRLDAAGNAVTVAQRAKLDALYYDSVSDAMDAMKAAKTARELSRADQKLTAAVSEMVAEASGRLDSENHTMLQTAADDFSEQGSFLRQEARSFNEKAEKAEALYEKLPTKFVLPQPDVYEGI